jgi:hypothetical protein
MDSGPARFAAHPGMTSRGRRLDRFVAFAPRDDGHAELFDN